MRPGRRFFYLCCLPFLLFKLSDLCGLVVNILSVSVSFLSGASPFHLGSVPAAAGSFSRAFGEAAIRLQTHLRCNDCKALLQID